jgi:hypothetical protein
VLGADAEGCSLATGQGRYSHNVWNRQEALRLQRQVTAAQKATERERKLQDTAAGKAQTVHLSADLDVGVARLESILRRRLDREAAIDLSAMLRTDEFPPLDLGTDGVAAPRAISSGASGRTRQGLEIIRAAMRGAIQIREKASDATVQLVTNVSYGQEWDILTWAMFDLISASSDTLGARTKHASCVRVCARHAQSTGSPDTF